MAQPNGDEIPYNSNISQSNGEWKSFGYDDVQTHTLYQTRIPLLPAHSEVRMKVRYTLHAPKDIHLTRSDHADLFWQFIAANATIQATQFTSND